MKRRLPVLLGLLLLAAPAMVHAQFIYTTNAGAITITGYSGAGGAVIIPAATNGLPVTSIGDSAFNSTLVASVTIPGSVTNIGAYAFQSCASLTNALLTNGLASAGDFAFQYCSRLAGLTIPASLTSIGDDAFDSCISLTNVTIPASVTNIGANAFFDCSGLTNVTFSNGVTSIGDDAFWRCTSLPGVAIPASVTNIGASAFEGCTVMTAITVDAQNPVYSSLNGVLFDTNQATLIEYPGGLGGTYAIPASVTSIGEFAFASCSGLTNVTLSDNVTNIGDGAFEDCAGLTAVTIPAMVTNIGSFAFFDCTGLTNFTLPASVTNIGDYAFSYCSGLTSLYFNGNAPGADSTLFVNAGNVTVYYLPAATGWSSPFAGRPAVLWDPLIQAGDANFGVRSNQFGFDITGPTNLLVVVQASTNLAAPVWTPLQSVTLTNGLFYFSEPVQTNAAGRFYSLGLP
ncbi:MAG TPA: leucine-rich repeat domain-containing protein [Candidatus Saccharimonadales bacterium]|nr:leucine-rich repeat domain-containing protein [Candidatus Saccharimonadales bacterium]